MAAVPRLSSLLSVRAALSRTAPFARAADLKAPAFRAAPEEGVMAILTRLADATDTPPTRLMADLATLALAPGRVTLSDYERLRLFDAAFWGEADRREVVGARRARELALVANFRHDWFALAGDRLAAGLYLAAHGLPAAPVLAIFRAGLAAPGRNLLRTREELREFLVAHAGTPLVALAAEGAGARVLFEDSTRDPARDPAAEIDRLVDEACDAPGASWIFQPLIAPHPATPRQAAGRLAPVRLLTLAGERGAMAFRAVWRLGGEEGIVAALDPKTGRALCVAPAQAPHRARAAPAGLAPADWPALKAAAIEGARLFGHFGLIGWDIAPGADGPVILGLDPTPDLHLHQLLERRGVLEPPFLAFLDERRRLAAEWRRLEVMGD